MKGWRMILLVNGGLLLFMAASAWGIAEIATDCSGEQADTDCDPGGLEDPMRAVALGLVGVGIVLLALGVLWPSRSPPQP